MATASPPLTPSPPEPQLTMTGAKLLDWILAYIKRFISLSPEQGCVVALWVIHTHLIDATDFTPYLAINSPEKQSGKTKLLEVLRLLVKEEWFTGHATSAVLVRKIDAKAPTLLLDESDAAFNGDQTYTEALRGVLNTGHERGGCYSMCIGQGAAITYQDFSTFCPKAIAGIGRLPDTVTDRSIPIRLKRAPRGTVEKFRKRDAKRQVQEHVAQIAAWCQAHIKDLQEARPDIPTALSDRQADVCEPLLAIADAAGGEWPKTLRKALVKLCVGAQANDGSVGVQLLRDVKGVFDEKHVDEMASAILCDSLALIETSPWGEWNKGKPLTPAGIARLLKPFEVYPEQLSSGKVRGYKLRTLEEAFSLYIPPQSVKPSESQYPCGSDADFRVSEKNPADTLKNAVSANNDAGFRRFDTLKAETGEGVPADWKLRATVSEQTQHHQSAQTLIQLAAFGLASLRVSTEEHEPQ